MAPIRREEVEQRVMFTRSNVNFEHDRDVLEARIMLRLRMVNVLLSTT